MKKIFFTAMALAMPLFASAQSEIITVTPVVAAANAGLDGGEVTWDLTFDVNIEHDAGKNLCSAQFDILIPDVLTPEFGEGTILPQYKSGKNYKYYHTLDITEHPELAPAGYTQWRVLVYDSKNTEFDFSEGNDIMTVAFATGATEGFYPIYIKGVAVSYFDALDEQQKDVYANTVSYAKVGNPLNANLDLVDCVPACVNTALATETAIKTLDLSAVTALNGDFTYVAGRNVVAPDGLDANVKFDAPLAGKYGSFCAPVDVNVDCYTYSSCDGEYAVFSPATTAPAGVPVLLDKAVKTEAQAATLQSVQGIQISNGYYVAADGNGLHSVNTIANIPALRGAWDFAAASSNLRIAIETATGLQVIGTAEEVFGNSYDLQGRQVQNAKNGVFVVNGKKQFVK